MAKSTKPTIADLARELRLKDERIQELKNEIDELHHLVQRMEQYAQERDKLESFHRRWGELITNYSGTIDEYKDLAAKLNKLIRVFNRHRLPKAATKHFEKSAELLKEVKGLK